MLCGLLIFHVFFIFGFLKTISMLYPLLHVLLLRLFHVFIPLPLILWSFSSCSFCANCLEMEYAEQMIGLLLPQDKETSCYLQEFVLGTLIQRWDLSTSRILQDICVCFLLAYFPLSIWGYLLPSKFSGWRSRDLSTYSVITHE